MDKIKIKDLEVFAKHGVFPEENTLGQKFLVSVTLYTDTRKAGKTDDLKASVNYGEVCQLVTKFMKENTFQLIETVAEGLAESILLRWDLVEEVTVEVKKPWAPIGLPVDFASVEITRGWHTAYIALGSNMGDKKGFLNYGINALYHTAGCKPLVVSNFIETEAYGGVEQDTFLNGCLKMRTLLTPQELLRRLNQIEAEAGRERLVHWGPRTLDLDIIFYDDLICQENDLCIPHVDMQNRYFVLKPLHQIAPYKRHPGNGKTVHEMLVDLLKQKA